MITNDGKLTLLENFVPDVTLPKFKKTKAPGPTDIMLVSGGGEYVVPMSSFDRLTAPGIWVGVQPQGLWQRLLAWFKGRRARPRMTVTAFFTSVKNAAKDLDTLASRAQGYEAALLRAKDAGQTALYEQLTKSLVAVRAETQLVTMGMTKYLEEDVVVNFVKRSSRGLRLDWVANFTRHLPSDLVQKKRDADERGIFDNYAVMHYDPARKAVAETEEQKAKRKDPILFGVIEGRRRLYYVGDWVDEFCDLTLDQIADKLGSGAVNVIDPNEFLPKR
jgi:hypothetical protein